MHNKAQQVPNGKRNGATLVEMAVVLPVFGVFLVGLMEFGHAYMVATMLKAAVNKAARYGVVEDISTAQVAQKTRDILASTFDTNAATVYVKDASVFDVPETDASSIQYDSLPDIELLDAGTRQLFVVRVELPYNDVALLPPFFIKGVNLSAQSVVRHE